MKRIIDFVAKHPVSITAFFCLVFVFLPFKPKPFGDGEYHLGTIQLIDFLVNGCQGAVGVDKGLFTLFYYFIPYSLAYVFHSNSLYYFFGVVFNLIIICGAIKYLFASFELMGFTQKSKFWTVLVLNVFPIHIYYAMGILSETGSFFAVCLIIYFWVKIKTNKSQSVFDFGTLAFCVLMLISLRPNLILFGLLFLLFILISRYDIRNKLVFSGVFLGLFVFIFFVEKAVDPNFGVFKKEEAARQLVRSRYELREEPFNWMPQHYPHVSYSSDYLNYLSTVKEFDSICKASGQHKTRYYIDWSVNDILHNPLLTARQYGLKFIQAQSFIISPLMKSNKSNWIKIGIHFYINSINYILIVISVSSLFVLIKEKKGKLVFPFLLLWICSLLYVFIFHSEQRYLFPMRPVLFFLFAYYINFSFRRKINFKKVN